MADDGLSVLIDPALAERLRAAADAAGRPVQDYAAGLIAQGLQDDWAEDYARFSEYERTGGSVSAEDAFSRFRSQVETRLSRTR